MSISSYDTNNEVQSWRIEIVNHMMELDKFVPVPRLAFELVNKANPDDYECMSETDTVDLIIQEAQIRSST